MSFKKLEYKPEDLELVAKVTSEKEAAAEAARKRAEATLNPNGPSVAKVPGVEGAIRCSVCGGEKENECKKFCGHKRGPNKEGLLNTNFGKNPNTVSLVASPNLNATPGSGKPNESQKTPENPDIGFGLFENRIENTMDLPKYIEGLALAIKILETFPNRKTNHPILELMGIERAQVVEMVRRLFGSFNGTYSDTNEVSLIGSRTEGRDVARFLFEEILKLEKDLSDAGQIDPILADLLYRLSEFDTAPDKFFQMENMTRIVKVVDSIKKGKVLYDDLGTAKNIVLDTEQKRIAFVRTALRLRGNAPKMNILPPLESGEIVRPGNKPPDDDRGGDNKGSKGPSLKAIRKTVAEQPVVPPAPPEEAEETDAEPADIVEEEPVAPAAPVPPVAPVAQPAPIPVVHFKPTPAPIQPMPSVAPAQPPIKPVAKPAHNPKGGDLDLVLYSSPVAAPDTPVAKPVPASVPPVAPFVTIKRAPDPTPTPVAQPAPASVPPVQYVAPAVAPVVPLAQPAPAPVQTAQNVEQLLESFDVQWMLGTAKSAAVKHLSIRRLIGLATGLTHFDNNNPSLLKLSSHRENPIVAHFMDNQKIPSDEILIHVLSVLKGQGKDITPDNLVQELIDMANIILKL